MTSDSLCKATDCAVLCAPTHRLLDARPRPVSTARRRRTALVRAWSAAQTRHLLPRLSQTHVQPSRLPDHQPEGGWLLRAPRPPTGGRVCTQRTVVAYTASALKPHLEKVEPSASRVRAGVDVYFAAVHQPQHGQRLRMRRRHLHHRVAVAEIAPPPAPSPRRVVRAATNT